MPTQQGESKVDATAKAEGPEQHATPEDVVRRLLEAEPGNKSSARPVSRKVSAPGHATGKAPGKPTPVGRLVAAPKNVVRDIWARGQAAVVSYRPDPRHMALLLLAIIVLSMPWLIPALLLLGLIVLLISYLTLGPDRATELVSAWHGWLTRRNPQGAEALRARAERLSARLSAWAIYLPERWTSGLYLPDFSRPDETQDKLSDDPFDRLMVDTQNQ